MFTQSQPQRQKEQNRPSTEGEILNAFSPYRLQWQKTNAVLRPKPLDTSQTDMDK